MIVHNKPTYKCEHCRKLYQIKGACEKHEKACPSNPLNFRPCNDCSHCSKTPVKYTFDGSSMNGPVERTETINILHCRSKNIYLVPPKAEHRGNYYESESLGDGDIENVSMPRECDKFEIF